MCNNTETHVVHTFRVYMDRPITIFQISSHPIQLLASDELISIGAD